MSVTIKTFVLYGTEVDISNFDKSQFVDEEEYVDYLNDVINKIDSPYKLIYDEDSDSYCFGYVIDESIESSWENTYLKSITFSQMKKCITENVRDAFDWLLLLHFNTRARNRNIDYMILTVYC